MSYNHVHMCLACLINLRKTAAYQVGITLHMSGRLLLIMGITLHMSILLVCSHVFINTLIHRCINVRPNGATGSHFSLYATWYPVEYQFIFDFI